MAVSIAEEFTEPRLTCDGVLSETAFHLGSYSAVLKLIDQQTVMRAFDCNDHLPQIEALAFLRKRTLTIILDVRPKALIYMDGGTAGTRTQDQSLKRALLYQLSYRPNERRMIAEVRRPITASIDIE
jgi:hypothetical protein